MLGTVEKHWRAKQHNSQAIVKTLENSLNFIHSVYLPTHNRTSLLLSIIFFWFH